ncbi:MAG: hypothetical protein GX072_13100 [Lysinibacillus sp.]|nr:hypothetical protein [Lysinibacillus sp.]
MDQRRFAYIVVSMVMVAVFAMLMLNNLFPEVPKDHKILIVISATLFSGVIARLMFPKELEEEDDSKEKRNTN